MSFGKTFSIVAVSAVALALVRAAGTPAAPIPPGFNWPAPEQQLIDWSLQQKISLMRQHAWDLWAGINQPATPGKVVWQTWWSVTDTLHLDVAGAPHKTLTQFNVENVGTGLYGSAQDQQCTGSVTIQPCYGSSTTGCQGNCVKQVNGNWEVVDGKWFANNGDIMIAGEYYNQEAYDHIQKYKLYLSSSLNPASGSSIPIFPRRAIVLKSMSWPVRGDGLTALPVWDAKPTRPYWDYNGYETWTRGVAIDASGAPIQPGKTASVTYLYNVGGFNPITFANAKVVPVSAFYNRKIGAAEWAAMDSGDKCILNQSANWAYNRNFQPGDYVVTIAMHIVTKEIPDWAMQTFWWHDQPNDGPFAEDRPAKLPPGAWQHYLGTEAWNMVTPREFDGSPYVAMNPYIELVVPERCRMTTNCQNCHARGAYPAGSGAGKAHYDTTVRGYIGPNDPIFKGLKRTDFQWAIPDRAH